MLYQFRTIYMLKYQRTTNSIDYKYSSIMRVCDYLATMSFAEQYEFGLKILRDFGVIQ